MSKNRNPIKQWEITFPQSGDVSREDYLKSFPPCTSYIVALEKHADGGNHLHGGFKFKRGISHSNLLKWIKVKYPEDWKRIHFTAIKNMKNWIDYCNKEDPECLQLDEEWKPRVRKEDPAVWIANEALEIATMNGEAKKAKWLKEEVNEWLTLEDQWGEYYKKLGY